MEYNKGHDIEGCDRLHIAMAMIADHILDHPATIKAECRDDVKMALDSLMFAYQKVAKLE